MKLLKKENGIANIILMVLTLGLYTFVLAHLVKAYEKDAWYTKWQYWSCACICLFFPVFIFFLVFSIQIMVKVASNLNVPGSSLYTSPYTWIICLVVPVLGWALLLIMLIYIYIWIFVMLFKGEGEKYITI